MTNTPFEKTGGSNVSLSVRLGLILMLVVMMSAVAQAKTQMRRDGEYWRTIPETEKLDIILGLFDGMTLSESLAQIVVRGGSTKCSEAIGSISRQTSQYLDNLTTAQISSGLDAFYEEEANRRIPIFWGVWVVARKNKGGRDVDTFVEELRRSYR